MEVYGDLISALLDVSYMFADTADYCRRLDNHVALQRIGIERATLAAMMTARVEQLGFKLSVRPSRLLPAMCLVRGLADCLTNTDARLIMRLERAEDRLDTRFGQALADPRLGSAVAELIKNARSSAVPGHDVRRIAPKGFSPA